MIFWFCGDRVLFLRRFEGCFLQLIGYSSRSGLKFLCSIVIPILRPGVHQIREIEGFGSDWWTDRLVLGLDYVFCGNLSIRFWF